MLRCLVDLIPGGASSDHWSKTLRKELPFVLNKVLLRTMTDVSGATQEGTWKLGNDTVEGQRTVMKLGT